MEEKIVFESTDEVLVVQVCEMLKERNINYIRRNEGVSSYLNIVWGSNTTVGMVKKVFVDKDDYEKAKEIIEIFNKDIENSEDEEIPKELKDNNESQEEINKEINKYKRMKAILFVWISLIMILMVVMIGIISSLNY